MGARRAQQPTAQLTADKKRLKSRAGSASNENEISFTCPQTQTFDRTTRPTTESHALAAFDPPTRRAGESAVGNSDHSDNSDNNARNGAEAEAEAEEAEADRGGSSHRQMAVG